MRLIDADALLEMVEDTELTFDGGVDINELGRIINNAPTIARIDAIDNERMFLYKWRIDNKNPEYFPDKIKINKGLLTAIQEIKE